MQTYSVTIRGKTPLLLHHDNIDWADFMDTWKSNPDNKRSSKAGDDRSPAWRWIGCLYTDDEHVVVPQANIMRSLMEGGAMVPVPGGKMGKTFKAQTQSGMMTVQPSWVLRANGKPVEAAPLLALKDEDSFAKHKEAAREHGVELLVKRAKIGTSKHVRVRPQFTNWEISGEIAVWDAQITAEILALIIEFAGQYKGLGDWRPGGKTPGPYGMFEGFVE